MTVRDVRDLHGMEDGRLHDHPRGPVHRQDLMRDHMAFRLDVKARSRARLQWREEGALPSCRTPSRSPSRTSPPSRCPPASWMFIVKEADRRAAGPSTATTKARRHQRQNVVPPLGNRTIHTRSIAARALFRTRSARRERARRLLQHNSTTRRWRNTARLAPSDLAEHQREEIPFVGDGESFRELPLSR